MSTKTVIIEDADNLTEVDIVGNSVLTEFSVSNAPALTVAGITNFSNMVSIQTLELKGMAETGSIDVSFAPNLKKIDTTGTPAASVKVAESVLANPTVVVTVDSGTAVTIPPLPPTTTAFTLPNSYITTYDFSTLPNLVSITITNSDFATLNVSANAALASVNAYGNKISSLTLPTTPNAALLTLNVGNNLLTGALNTSGYSSLSELNCDLNTITGLVLPPSLQVLSCSGNPAIGGGTLNLTGVTNLQNIIATACNLTGITVTANTALTALNVNGNLLTGLNLSGNPNLDFLSCNDNIGITTLNLASNPLLGSLRCAGCGLIGLNVAGNTALTYLQCDGNNINQVAADAIATALVANGYAGGGTLIIQGQRAPIGNLTITGGPWTALAGLGWIIS